MRPAVCRMPMTLNFWVFITIVLGLMMGESCFGWFGLFGLSCETSVLIFIGWFVVSALVSGLVCIALASLMSDRPGQ